MSMTHIVYILKCEGNKLYTGYTTNLNARFAKHIKGEGANFTKAFKPQEIAAYWEIEAKTKSIPLKVEAAIKKLNREQKDLLIKKPSLIQSYLDFEISLAD